LFLVFELRGHLVRQPFLRLLHLPSHQHLRDFLQLRGQHPALAAMLQMRRGVKSLLGGKLAVEVGHQLFGFDTVIQFAHSEIPSSPMRSLLATALLSLSCFLFSPAMASGCRRSFSAMRARNNRDRTVFTGTRSSCAISL